MGIWEVLTDRDRCMGTGNCVFIAPHVFDVDATGRVRLIGPVEEGDELVRQAVEACPMGALTLIEDAAERGGEESSS